MEDEELDLQAALVESKRTAKAERRRIRHMERSAFADDASSLSSDEDSDDEDQTMAGVQPPLITNEEYNAQMAEA